MRRIPFLWGWDMVTSRTRLRKNSYRRQGKTMRKTITINGISYPASVVGAASPEMIAELFGGTVQDRPEWHDAKPGEVWQVTRGGTTPEIVWMVANNNGCFEDYIYEYDVTDHRIVHAERVYPDLFRSPNE